MSFSMRNKTPKKHMRRQKPKVIARKNLNTIAGIQGGPRIQL